MKTDEGKGRFFQVDIEYDQDTENPLEFCSAWTLHSFGRRHSNYTDPESLGLSLERDEDGIPIIRDLGLRRKLDVGLAFWLSYYEHGTSVWSLKGEGSTCRWDSVQVAGLLVWNHKPSEIGAKTVEDRAKDARMQLSTYNAWANNSCYWFGVTEVDEDGEEIDGDYESCGGFIVDENDSAMYFLRQACDCIPLGAHVEFTGEGEAFAHSYSIPFLDKDDFKCLTPEELDKTREEKAIGYGLGADTPDYAIRDYEEENGLLAS